MPITTREINNLDDLMDGGVTERFNAALAEVLQNVFDPNTAPDAKRKISLIFTFTPNERRSDMDLKSDVKITLAPPVPMTQTVMIAQDGNGGFRAMIRTNQLTGQLDMDGGEHIPKVVNFNKARERMEE